MTILVTYYSKTGNTRKVAEEISRVLGGDLDEIKDSKNWEGPSRILSGSLSALLKRKTEISTGKDPSGYDLVVVGTPVWAGRPAPAVRTYLSKNKLNKVAFFCTCGSHPAKTFDVMEELSSRPLAKLSIKERELPGKEEIEKFCEKLK